ncbi:helix-turn-helix domain-containing protein [Actinophytocola sp.]|uniref:helix-turn-helix domain-containing protein n=1 Tax=Actinophytocola sp. TaxID=1872138 RepID=UPI002D7F2D61|nr:helix-turn-helix domain-containing protein [Actinophytocola sp.]HET9138779.1 helix-turn-helix domain-containing protein [Actinophytocola sp.]
MKSSHDLVLYTKYEAAEILRVKVSWLERRAAARQIPFTMLGGTYRFTPEHLAEIVRLSEPSGGAAAVRPERRRQRRREASRQVPDGFIPLRPRPRRAA